VSQESGIESGAVESEQKTRVLILSEGMDVLWREALRIRKVSGALDMELSHNRLQNLPEKYTSLTEEQATQRLQEILVMNMRHLSRAETSEINKEREQLQFLSTVLEWKRNGKMPPPVMNLDESGVATVEAIQREIRQIEAMVRIFRRNLEVMPRVMRLNDVMKVVPYRLLDVRDGEMRFPPTTRESWNLIQELFETMNKAKPTGEDIAMIERLASEINAMAKTNTPTSAFQMPKPKGQNGSQDSETLSDAVAIIQERMYVLHEYSPEDIANIEPWYPEPGIVRIWRVLPETERLHELSRFKMDRLFLMQDILNREHERYILEKYADINYTKDELRQRIQELDRGNQGERKKAEEFKNLEIALFIASRLHADAGVAPPDTEEYQAIQKAIGAEFGKGGSVFLDYLNRLEADPTMHTERERSLPFVKEYADYRNRLFRLLCQPEFTGDTEAEIRRLAQEVTQWMITIPSIFQMPNEAP